MVLNDWGKLLALLVVALTGAAICIVSLVQGHGVDPAGVAMVTSVLGYVTGNGVLAAKKSAPSPVYVPNLPAGQWVDDDDDMTELPR